jgi:DNA processing protein
MTSALTAPGAAADRPRQRPINPPPRAAEPPRRPSDSPERPPETTLREAAAALALIMSGSAGQQRLADDIEQRGSAAAVLLRERLGAAPQTSFFSDPEAELDQELMGIERQIGEWRAQGLQLVTVLDARYPENLRSVAERPALLFVAGRLKPRDATGIAVIGTPDADRAEIRAATELATGLAASGHTVISGLAAGIDTTAHLAALKRGGRTIAVIATGLSRCYPRANVILQRRIAAECAVVSQFVPETAPSGDTFAARNSVMSGLALATIVVAASSTSTPRAHAREAVAQSRPLILFDALLRHKWARELAELPLVAVAATPDEALQATETLTATAAALTA